MTFRTDLAAGRRMEFLVAALCLVAGLALYVMLRIRWIGHLVTWDEAMSLLTVRSFVLHSSDPYSHWFWRHPPLHKLLLTQLNPLLPGFAERAEALSIFCGALTVAVLFSFNRLLYGVRVAFFSVVFLAVMPRSMLYDVWIKSDVLVMLPCLVALWLFIGNHPLKAGLALGVAFLIKETAIFYALAIFVLWCLQPRPAREWKNILAVALTAIAMSAWWYGIFSVSVKHFIALATGVHLEGVETTTHPWYFYFDKLGANIGLSGIVFSLLGVLSIRARMSAAAQDRRWFLGQSWPLALLVPANAILQAIPARSLHFATVLESGWATLQAVGLDWALAAFVAGLTRANFRNAVALAAAEMLVLGVLFGNLILHAAGADYDDLLGQQDVGAWGAAASREAALAMNRVVQKDQRAIITPTYYWQDENRVPDPIFVYYLDPMPVLVLPMTVHADELVRAVRRYQIDWAMLSPDPRDAPETLAIPLHRTYGLRPMVLRGSLIYRTSSLYGGAAGTNRPAPPR